MLAVILALCHPPGENLLAEVQCEDGQQHGAGAHESTLINPCQIIASNNLCFGILLSGLLELSGKNMWLSSPEGGGSGLE